MFIMDKTKNRDNLQNYLYDIEDRHIPPITAIDAILVSSGLEFDRHNHADFLLPVFSWSTNEMRIDYCLTPSKRVKVRGEKWYSLLSTDSRGIPILPYQGVIKKLQEKYLARFNVINRLAGWGYEFGMPEEITNQLKIKAVGKFIFGVLNAQRTLDKAIELEAERIFEAAKRQANVLEV